MVFARQGVQVLTRDIDTDDTQENFLDVTTVDNTGIDKQDSVITVLLKFKVLHWKRFQIR